MAKWTAKEIVIKVANVNEAILFLEALQKQIKTVDIIADYFPSKVFIRLEGAKEHLKNAIGQVKELHQIVKSMLYPDLDNFFEFNLTFLSQMTGKTFPVKTLLRILTLQGYESFQEGDALITQAPYKTLEPLLSLLDTLLENMPYEISTASLRDVLATIAILREETVEDALVLAWAAAILKEDEYHRLSLCCEPEQAVEKVLKITKQQKELKQKSHEKEVI